MAMGWPSTQAIARVCDHGIVEGTRCLASMSGPWRSGTIRRAYADGTFRVELDVKEMIILPHWDGVTPCEISTDDASRWPAVAEALWPGKVSFTRDDFDAILAVLAIDLPKNDLDTWWTTAGGQLFAGKSTLDRDELYRMTLHGGMCAKQVAMRREGGPSRDPWFKLYWNQTRMGGRTPSEIARAVTLDDALAALGLVATPNGDQEVAAIAAFEASANVKVPATLRALFSKRGVRAAVTKSHPCSPTPLEWSGRRGLRAHGIDGDIGVRIMDPHQGGHAWIAIFDEGEDDARIYVDFTDDDGTAESRIDARNFHLTAPSVGLFFWDLAQTGFAWWNETGHDGGKPFVKTDIGYAAP
jgi:hypothetical protein